MLVISWQVDIEGSELKALPQWISSGMMEYVDQFGIEIHTAPGSKPEMLLDLLQVFQQLFENGFQLISSMNNECVGTKADSKNKYYSLFEVVFYKSDVQL